MSSFLSSLVINTKTFKGTHQVFNPRYNKEFFKRLAKNIDLVKSVSKIRLNESEFRSIDFESVKENSIKLANLRDRLEKLGKRSEESGHEYADLQSKIESLEEKLLPVAVLIPNRPHNATPEEDRIIDHVESEYAGKSALAKVLSHKKLSYINNCYTRSVVGPNSAYYLGIGAKLHFGLADFFTAELERERFILASGLCLVKSALVEATNHKLSKDYATDPCRILADDARATTIHLVEASRESLVGLVTSIKPTVSLNSLRFMTRGAGYRSGSDVDEKQANQFETVHALSYAPPIEKYSSMEYDEFRNIIWSMYKKLKLPTRLIHCCLNSLLANEHCAHRIDIWLPSKQEWVQVCRISHYLDYITVRTGMKRGHLIDSMVYDGNVLFAAILENNQTPTGRFIVPSVIKEHMICLTESENKDYFDNQGSESQPFHLSPTNQTLLNHEQRRYISKRKNPFGHSRRSIEYHQSKGMRTLAWVAIATLIVAVDFREIWIQFFPDALKRITYDYMYRPVRRIYWFIVYPAGTKKPEDLSFDQLDLKYFRLSEAKRSKLDIQRETEELEARAKLSEK